MWNASECREWWGRGMHDLLNRLQRRNRRPRVPGVFWEKTFSMEQLKDWRWKVVAVRRTAAIEFKTVSSALLSRWSRVKWAKPGWRLTDQLRATSKKNKGTDLTRKWPSPLGTQASCKFHDVLCVKTFHLRSARTANIYHLWCCVFFPYVYVAILVLFWRCKWKIQQGVWSFASVMTPCLLVVTSSCLNLWITQKRIKWPCVKSLDLNWDSNT